MADDETLTDPPSVTVDDAVRISVEVDGKVLDTLPVLTLTIRRAINHIPWAEIVLFDGNLPTGSFDLSDSPTFAPGAEVTIRAGYAEVEAMLFRGIVVRHGLKIDDSNRSRLVVECRDKTLSMTVGRHNARYLKRRDSDILRTLIDKHGLSAEVTDTRTEHDKLVQFHSSDWDFMVARAKANGLLVNVDAGVVRVKAPSSSGLAVSACSWGDNLISFDADIDAAQSKGGADHLHGRAGFRGSASAVPDSLIDVKGVGTRFSGTFYVSAVEHVFCRGNWVTHAEFGLPPERHVAREDDAATLDGDALPGTGALQVEDGVITVITPGKNRVVLDDDSQTITLQDAHDNSVRLSKDGIALNSRSDISLSAQGTVTITANAAIDIRAQTDATMTGLNVACEAQRGFTAKGSATAELSSTGQTTVKGAIVMIN